MNLVYKVGSVGGVSSYLINLGGVPLKLYSTVSCVYPDVS